MSTQIKCLNFDTCRLLKAKSWSKVAKVDITKSLIVLHYTFISNQNRLRYSDFQYYNDANGFFQIHIFQGSKQAIYCHQAVGTQ